MKDENPLGDFLQIYIIKKGPLGFGVIKNIIKETPERSGGLSSFITNY